MSKPDNNPTSPDPDIEPIRPDLPFLTADVPGLGGVLKATPADFQV